MDEIWGGITLQLQEYFMNGSTPMGVWNHRIASDAFVMDRMSIFVDYAPSS